MNPENKLKQLMSLFLSFFQVGLFTFGGGYAMLPMLQKECIEKKGWTTEEELLDVFALAQCTPGIIAVNTATYIGKKQAGVAGSVCTTLGVIAPSLILISLIAALLQNFADYPAVQHALAGVRAAVVALIFVSVFKMAKSALKNAVSIVIAVCAFLLVALFGVSPVAIVVAAALVGYLFLGGLETKKEDDA